MKFRKFTLLMLNVVTACACVMTTGSIAFADCEIVSNGRRIPFDGGDLQNLAVEKKSLLKLDRMYPNLNVVEKTFKGEITTCSNCTDNFLVCGS